MQQRLRAGVLVVSDIIILNISFILSILVRFEFEFPIEYFHLYMSHILVFLLVKLLVFKYFKLYSSLWRYASIDELIKVAMAVASANALFLSYSVIKGAMFPRSIYVLLTIFDMALVGGVRFSYRVTRKVIKESRHSKDEKRIMIVGAGSSGVMVLKEMREHAGLNSVPVAFIDDDMKKQRKTINGIPVLGKSIDIYDLALKQNIDEIIIAMPSAKRSDIKKILDECKRTRCKIKTLPGMFELIDGKVSISQLRDVQIDDLLGRETVKLDEAGISSYIYRKKVLITGGGGSIGSELCRQIARFEPEELVILDIYENNAYDLQNELLQKFRGLNLKVIIASVRDVKRIDQVVRDIMPDVIFHAAAHKHVPLMEANPKEAIKNNVFGTLNLVQAVDRYGVDKFVLISTDKAVNPTNIMGASKRLCEMIVQSINRTSKSDFVAVRFGNVLGSNGSVIPLFKRQIEMGGPVTVTDPHIIRYFMTIPEASQLVIQAGAIAKGGEVFVLDMGEPVRIADLAEDLIKLSGYEPNVDINIEFTGLRPGEKLFEELLMDEENMSSTGHEMIFIGKPICKDYQILLKDIEMLKDAVDDGSDEAMKTLMKSIVETYKEPDEVNLKVIKSRRDKFEKCLA